MSLQSCPTLCDPMDCSLPGFSIHGILQARTLEWVTIFFSNAWKWKVKVKSLSHVWLLVTPWTAAYQALPSMGFFQARILDWVAIAFSYSQIVLQNFCYFKEMKITYLHKYSHLVTKLHQFSPHITNWKRMIQENKTVFTIQKIMVERTLKKYDQQICQSY